MSLLQAAEAEFQALTQRAPAAELAFRQEAWREFQRLGLPDRKTETWKYSSLSSLLKREWTAPQIGSTVLRRARELQERWQAQFEVILIQNGEVKSGPLHDASQSPRRAEGTFEDGFLGISAALSRPVLNLHVKSKRARPLMIIHALSGDGIWSKTYHRVTVDPQMELDVVEWFVGEGIYLRSDLMRVEVGRGAHVNWVRIQDEALTASHFGDYRATLNDGAVLNVSQIQSGSQWTRSTLTADVCGTAAEARISGLTFARGDQHMDQRVVANHHAANTTSAQLFKGVLKDRAKGVVNGRIFIAQDAQNVNSSQLNHNLLLSSQAEANTKPELEIYADDVKANHGASVGRMDDEKLFYLESRGIRRTEAMQILARAFVGDVVMKVNHRLRPVIDEAVSEILPEFAKQMEQGS